MYNFLFFEIKNKGTTSLILLYHDNNIYTLSVYQLPYSVIMCSDTRRTNISAVKLWHFKRWFTRVCICHSGGVNPLKGLMFLCTCKVWALVSSPTHWSLVWWSLVVQHFTLCLSHSAVWANWWCDFCSHCINWKCHHDIAWFIFKCRDGHWFQKEGKNLQNASFTTAVALIMFVPCAIVNVLWLLYVVISVKCGTVMWDEILPLASATFFMWRLRSNFGWTTTLTTGAHSSLGVD